MTGKQMRILGIDPGASRTGWGVIESDGKNPGVLDYGMISTSSAREFPEKIKFISSEISKLIEKYAPAAVAIEEPFYGQNARAMIKMGQVAGAVMATAFGAGLEASTYSVLEIKQAVAGYGRADKKQVQEMVKILLKMGRLPEPADAADALAAALCHQNRLGRNPGFQCPGDCG